MSTYLDQLARWPDRLHCRYCLSLRVVLVVPFLVQLLLSVGLVGYMFHQAGREAVENLTNQLMAEIGEGVNRYLAELDRDTRLINRLVADALSRGEFDLDLARLDPRRDRFLWQQAQLSETLSWISLGAGDGNYHGVFRDPTTAALRIVAANPATGQRSTYFMVDAGGGRGRLVDADPGHYDPRQRPWYRGAMAAGAWIDVYAGFTPGTVFYAASRPVRDRAGRQGVVAVDVSLDSLGRFLADLPLARHGLVFVVDGQDRLLATSRGGALARRDDRGQPLLETLAGINDPLIRAATAVLEETPAARLRQVTVGEEDYFLRRQRYTRADGSPWYTVAMVPCAVFLGDIPDTACWTVTLAALTLLVALVGASLSAHWIVAPIVRLNRAARRLGETDFQAPGPLLRGDEVGELSRSFHRMAGQLREAFRVLREDQQRLHQFLEAMPVGVAIHRAGGALYYVNRLGRSILGAEDLVELDRYHDAWAVPLEEALAGQRSFAREVEIHRADGLVPLQVTATPVFAADGRVEYAICAFLDITQRKQTEHVLRHYNQRLERRIRQRTEALEQEVRERKQTEVFLRESQTRLQSLATMLPGCTFSFVLRPGSAGAFEFVSPGVEDLLEVPVGRFLEDFRRVIAEQLHPEDHGAFFRAFRHSARALARLQHEWRMIGPAGRLRWLQVNSQPERRDDGSLRWHGIVLDISSRKQAEEALRAANQELQRLVNVDGLTQVANRRAFDERLEGEWRRLQRAGRPLSLLLLDVDYFKPYNDHYGHPRGDECLIRIARAIREMLHRPGDLVARYGGEEFAVVLPDTDLEGAAAVAEQLRRAVGGLAMAHEVSPIGRRVTISIGVASSVPGGRLDQNRLIEWADQALYLAKRQGRDRYEVFIAR